MNEIDKSQTIKIENENDAWEIFEKALEGEFDDQSDIELTFSNWPQIDIKLKGVKHKASLTAKNMEGLVELQTTLFRTYALTVHNKLNAKNLTNDEKEKLTIIFQVSEGSSDVWAELIKVLSILAKDMTKKLEPKHYVITVLGISLIWGSTATLSTYLQHQKDLFVAEQQTVQKKNEIDERIFASEQEFRKMEILTNAFQYNPQLEQIRESVDAMNANLLQKFSDADEISVQGTKKIKSKTIQQIFKKKRVGAVEDRLDGLFRIIKVDSSTPDHFNVTVRNISDGTIVKITIQDSYVIDKKKKQCLQDAEWSKVPVLLRMNIKRLRGVIVNASILNVEEAPDSIIDLINQGKTDIKVTWSDNKGFQYITKNKNHG